MNLFIVAVLLKVTFYSFFDSIRDKFVLIAMSWHPISFDLRVTDAFEIQNKTPE